MQADSDRPHSDCTISLFFWEHSQRGLLYSFI